MKTFIHSPLKAASLALGSSTFFLAGLSSASAMVNHQHLQLHMMGNATIVSNSLDGTGIQTGDLMGTVIVLDPAGAVANPAGNIYTNGFVSFDMGSGDFLAVSQTSGGGEIGVFNDAVGGPMGTVDLFTFEQFDESFFGEELYNRSGDFEFLGFYLGARDETASNIASTDIHEASDALVNGGFRDLNELITAFRYNGVTGNVHWELSFLDAEYIAVPEPSTYALILGAAGLVGAFVVRRKSRRF